MNTAKANHGGGQAREASDTASAVVPASATVPYQPADFAMDGGLLPSEPVVAAQPFSVRGASSPAWTPPQPWDLTLDEVIQVALANSTILRDLGARVVQSPGLTPTIYGPALQASDPVTGVEAALSAFDAQVASDLFFENNDRVLNNEFLGGGVNFFRQDLARFQSSLKKKTASGALYTLRHNVDGDLNNSTRNLLEGRAWSWNLEGEVRQPLLQGRGLAFNRIAGPQATPGVYNGVLLALLKADASASELEIGLRDYLSEVENAYWDLYFAFVDLEVKTKARDRSLGTLQLLQARARQGLPNAERDKLAQAKEQYFRFEEAVQNALGGRLVIGTRTFNGSGGGSFQGSGGIYANERRLRLIMGLPINDGRLIRTISQPPEAPTIHDWQEVVSRALARRTELRRQQLVVERHQLELVASRNFTLPQLDALGRYRYRGLGNHLYDPYANDLNTNTHEWFLGLSLAYPVGYRQGHAAVHNAQLRLSRELEMLNELERQVIYGVSNAVAEEHRAYEVWRFAINRAQAAQEQYDILFPEAQAPVRQFDFNALLDSERRLAEAETNAHSAAVQYALASKNVNFEMGTLLEYFNIHLAGGAWPRRKVSSSRRASLLPAAAGALWSETAELPAAGTAWLADSAWPWESPGSEADVGEPVPRPFAANEGLADSARAAGESAVGGAVPFAGTMAEKPRWEAGPANPDVNYSTNPPRTPPLWDTSELATPGLIQVVPPPLNFP
ncbi:MAG: TolC family protein [Planctomycetales bacterium]|nr:TolC family protein [Planctomycetales bacterium]